jgi:hypothetical protein
MVGVCMNALSYADVPVCEKELSSIVLIRNSLSLQYVDGMRHGDGIMHYADALFSDVGYTIRAGFMFDEPRVSARMTKVDDDTTITRPQDGDRDPDDNLQYWGQINTNYLVGDGYQGGGR